MATESGEKIVSRLIEDEMRESFIDYSMSVIVQRALPDIRDGLKPVHRRILYAMHELGLQPGRPHKKSATVVGDVLGKYHPHGDMAVYDALVRMVQDFSMRYPLVDGQGNFGSIDGDNAAAYRYTEGRLAPLATELLADIDKNTVDFVPNFDGRLQEPTVLPARVPNLLVNGSAGIAVGMATNIPPHNLKEIVAAVVAIIDDPDIPWEKLGKIITAPDFPTGGYICGTDGIRDAYREGRGRLVLRARTTVEDAEASRPRLVVTEIPYMVNKARLIEQIAELVRDKKITDVSDLRDESDRDGLRIVIELKRDAIPDIVLNQLYKHTQMQSTFGVIMLALVGGVPRILPLKDMLANFLEHRHQVIQRRSQFELDQAQEREHILEGLKIAVDHIDAVIELIRKSPDAEAASKGLQEKFGLSDRQADAILNMRLARLTTLEIDNLEAELKELRQDIRRLKDILASRPRRLQIVKEELEELAAKYGDARRTEVIGDVTELDVEDLIADEEMVITVSHAGYVKRLPSDTYRRQRRGGRGLQGMETKEEDWVEHLFVASTHDYLLVFTRRGKCHWLKVHEVPQSGRTSRGKPIVNLLKIDPGDEVAALVPVREFREDQHVLFCTRQGQIKKTALSAYGNVRSVGIIAINVPEDDELIEVQITLGSNEVILATQNGMALRFHEGDVRDMGRAATGVRGIRLSSADRVVGMVVARPDASTLLVVTENGMGKRSPIDEYRLQKRGGKGIINVKTSEKTGKVVAIKAVAPDEEVVFITRNGVVNRQAVKGIRPIGRATQGVRLVSLDEGDAVVDVARIIPEQEDDQGAETDAPEYQPSGEDA